MKLQFRTNRAASKLKIIDTINSILEEYHKQGYKLTLRQLYYQLVSRDYIANTSKEYAKLSSICVMGRMNGLIDWNYIEDRTRKLYIEYAVGSVAEAIKDTADYYKLDRQKGQKNKMEIWSEKDAVSNILKRVTSYYHIPLVINRGYSSCSAMFDAYCRCCNNSTNNQETVILYVGDHDPSGLDMLRDINDRLIEFGVKAFTIISVALTMNQIKKYNPPPNPAKTTDTRSTWYIEKYGEESWELDALRPEVLKDTVEKAVLNYLDVTKFNKMLEQEIKDKKILLQMIQQIQCGKK